MNAANIVIVVLALVFGLARYVMEQREKRQQRQRPPLPDNLNDDLNDGWGEEDAGDWSVGGDAQAADATWAQVSGSADSFAAERQELRRSLDELIDDAEELLKVARVERSNWRLAEVMQSYVQPGAGALRKEIDEGSGRIALSIFAGVNHLHLVSDSVRTFIAQRRTSGLGEALGDVDTMARACYEPVFGFARANNISLTSAEPVAVLASFDLSIWTGFIPTGIAPLFLPEEFLTDVRWWPAIAHEIGHDVLAASQGVEQRLRDELGLPPEEVGALPIRMVGGRLQVNEVVRVFGAFFEEMFCDVFATMMLGPAYGYTMLELFAMPHAPQLTRRVRVSSGGGYDIHPPRLLRVLLCARVLRLMGEDEAAEEILTEWRSGHGDDGAVVFPMLGGGEVGVPAQALDGILGELVERLYSHGLDALDGHCLADVPGLEYGPHRAAEARRACEELLRGQVPAQHPPRAVIAGAVLAWRQARERRDAIAALARRAIVGVTEAREDAYTITVKHRAGERVAQGHPATRREAFLLHTILAPPPSARWRQRGRPGFLSRPKHL